MIYLDNATVAPPLPDLEVQIRPFLKDYWVPPMIGPHRLADPIIEIVQESYRNIYALAELQEDSADLILTSSYLESINQIIFTMTKDVAWSDKDFVTTVVDDVPIGMVMDYWKGGRGMYRVAVDGEGKVILDDLEKILKKGALLVSLSWAHPVLGVLQPVEELAKLCRGYGTFLHLEATQVLGKHYFNQDAINADFISFDGNPLHAYSGIGGIFTGNGMMLNPLLTGSSEQWGVRAGTINTALLVSLGIACKESLAFRDQMCTEVVRLRNLFESLLLEALPEIQVLFKTSMRLPTHSIIVFPGVDGEALLYHLAQQNIYATIGGYRTQPLSSSLASLGYDEIVQRCAVAFVLSRFFSEEDVHQAVEIIVQTYKKLKSLSKKWFKT